MRGFFCCVGAAREVEWVAQSLSSRKGFHTWFGGFVRGIGGSISHNHFTLSVYGAVLCMVAFVTTALNRRTKSPHQFNRGAYFFAPDRQRTCLVILVPVWDGSHVKHFHTLCLRAGLRFGCGCVFLCERFGELHLPGQLNRPADLSPKVAAGRFFSHGGEEVCDGVVALPADLRSACLDHRREVVAAEEYAVNDHGHAFHGDQCIKCGILDHEGTRNVDVIRHCPGNSRFAPTALVEVLAREVRELRALLTPSDPGSLPRDVPVLGTTPVGPSPVQVSRAVFERDANPDGTIDVLAHLSPADRESVRRLNEALAEEVAVVGDVATVTEYDPKNAHSVVTRKIAARNQDFAYTSPWFRPKR